jgi:hypothetical protein
METSGFGDVGVVLFGVVIVFFLSFCSGEVLPKLN